MGRLDRLAADHRTLSRRFRRRTGGGERRGARRPAGLLDSGSATTAGSPVRSGCVPLSVAGVERAGSAGGFRVVGSTERSSPICPARAAADHARIRPSRPSRPGVGGTGTVAVPLPGGRREGFGRRAAAGREARGGGSVGDDFPDPKRDVFVARFYPDGSLDGEFGSGGVVTTDLGALSEEVARDVVVQPDGRLVVAASGRCESGVLCPKRSTDLVDLRYTSAGTLDPDLRRAACCTCRQNPMARTS